MTGERGAASLTNIASLDVPAGLHVVDPLSIPEQPPAELMYRHSSNLLP